MVQVGAHDALEHTPVSLSNGKSVRIIGDGEATLLNQSIRGITHLRTKEAEAIVSHPAPNLSVLKAMLDRCDKVGETRGNLM